MAQDKHEVKTPEGPESGFRHYRGVMAILVKVLGAGAGLYFLLYLAGVFAYFNIYLLPNGYNALFMAVVLTLTFLLVPAGKGAPRDRLPWYDLLLILASLVGCLYIYANALELARFGKLEATPLEIALGAVTILALIEAVRRSFGWAMIIVVVAFILYAKFGYLLTGPLRTHYFSWSDLTADIYLSRASLFGDLTGIASSIIIAFVSFGVFFMLAGGGEFFLKLALAAAGGMRGGPAKAAIVGSALFGTVSGSGVANVVVTGSVTIPLMKSIGYRPYYAGAVEAIASTGGQITPPIMGATAFIMASLLAEPYSKIAIVAALPAVLYYISLYTQVDLQAAKQGLRGLPREKLPPIRMALKEGWEFTIPFLVLLMLLFVVKYPAVTSAIYTILVVIGVSLFRKRNRLSFRKCVDGLDKGLQDTLSTANIIALAAIVLSVLTVTGLGPRLSSGLVTLFGGSALTLVLAAGAACYIMGMGVSLTASYVLVSVLVAPALEKLGLPLIVSHFFILYMTTSTMFTPPYAPCSYVAGAIAGASPFRVGLQAMRLGIVCYLVPFIIVFNPALLLIGSPGEVALAVVTAMVGIFGLAAGIEGYLFSPMSWLQRLAFFSGGLLMTIPGLATDLVGIGILALAIFWQRMSARRANSTVVELPTSQPGSKD